MKRALSAFIAFTFILTAFIFLSPPVDAAWNPAGEKGEARFELIPHENKVHATLTYNLQNLDQDTIYDSSFYYARGVVLPRDARNIKVYDRGAPLTFTLEQSSGTWNLYSVNYNERLFYGVKYGFTVECDLPVETGVARFLAYGQTYAATVKILIPLGYSTELTEPSYVLERTSTHQVYTYSLARDGRGFVTEVLVMRKTEYQSLSGSARLKNKNVTITVQYWEGERNKAEYILYWSSKALPVLEELTGIPFLQPYPIVVRESTLEDTGGAAGVNSGVRGIMIAAPYMEDDGVLLHELAHYWATKPPFSEDWMREGFAELYAYLTLKKLGKDNEAADVRDGRFRSYERYKDKFNLPLSQWVNAPGVNDFDLFGYAKSFVFAFNLYEVLGLTALQRFNGEAFVSSRPVDWVEFIRLLTKTTGQDQSYLFAGWVVPGVAQPFGTSYESWQKAEKAYRQAEELLSRSKGALGIGEVENALEQARSLLLQGKYSEVIAQTPSVTKLYESWQRAEKAYREAEQSISGSRGALGLAEVEKSLMLARSMLTQGQYDSVPVQVQAALKLFARWQEVEKAYRETEGTINVSRSALGIERVQRELDFARDSLVKGLYEQVIPQTEVVLKLYAEWQRAEKVYREAEDSISRSKGALGIYVVESQLQVAWSLLVQGQFAQALSYVQSTLETYQQWQKVEKAYREMEEPISKSKGALGISVVENQLQAARDMLLRGQLDQALTQIQTTLQTYEKWSRAEQAYRPLEEIVAGLKGSLGIKLVEEEVAQVQDLLLKGNFDQALSRSQAGFKLYERWHLANRALWEAQQAVDRAKDEGRTWRLKDAEVMRGQSVEFLQNGKYDESTTVALQAKERAKKAVTPLKALAPLLIPLALAIGAVPGFILIRRRMKAKPAQG